MTKVRLCPGSGMGAAATKNGKCPYCKKPVGIQNKDVAAGGRDKGTIGNWGTAVIQLHYA